MIFGLTVAMLLAAQVPPVVSAPPSAADLADSRCLLAILRWQQQADVTDDSAAKYAGATFFMGKIVGRSGRGAVDLAGRVTEKQVKEMQDGEIVAISLRCMGEISGAIPQR